MDFKKKTKETNTIINEEKKKVTLQNAGGIKAPEVLKAEDKKDRKKDKKIKEVIPAVPLNMINKVPDQAPEAPAPAVIKLSEIEEDPYKKLSREEKLQIYNDDEFARRVQILDEEKIPVPKDEDQLKVLSNDQMEYVYVVDEEGRDVYDVNHKRRQEGRWKATADPIMKEHYEWLTKYYLTHNDTLDQNEEKNRPIPALRFKNHKTYVNTPGLNGVYESQKANNCYACAGTAMINQYIASRKSSSGKKDAEIKQITNQDMMRSYVPKIQSFPEGNGVIDEYGYYEQTGVIDKFAGKNKTEPGNIFALGDMVIEELKKNGIDDACLNRVYRASPKTNSVHDRSVRNNMKSYFADKISSIIDEGGVAAVCLTKPSGYIHYVTVTGINGEGLEVYNSSVGSKDKRQIWRIDDFIKNGYNVEINWISEKKSPEEFTAEYKNLDYDEEKGYSLKKQTQNQVTESLTHTKGVTVAKTSSEMGPQYEGISQFVYIPDSRFKSAPITMKEALEISAEKQREHDEEWAKFDRKAADKLKGDAKKNAQTEKIKSEENDNIINEASLEREEAEREKALRKAKEKQNKEENKQENKANTDLDFDEELFKEELDEEEIFKGDEKEEEQTQKQTEEQKNKEEEKEEKPKKKTVPLTDEELRKMKQQYLKEKKNERERKKRYKLQGYGLTEEDLEEEEKKEAKYKDKKLQSDKVRSELEKNKESEKKRRDIIRAYENKSKDYDSFGLGTDLRDTRINEADSSYMREVKAYLKDYLAIRDKLFKKYNYREFETREDFEDYYDNNGVFDRKIAYKKGGRGNPGLAGELTGDELEALRDAYQNLYSSVKSYEVSHNATLTDARGKARARQVRLLGEKLQIDKMRFGLSFMRRNIESSLDKKYEDYDNDSKWEKLRKQLMPTWSKALFVSDSIDMRALDYSFYRRKQKEEGTLSPWYERFYKWNRGAAINWAFRGVILYNVAGGLIDRTLGLATAVAANTVNLASKAVKMPLKLMSGMFNGLSKMVGSKKRWRVNVGLTEGWQGIEKGRRTFRRYLKGACVLPAAVVETVTRGVPAIFGHKFKSGVYKRTAKWTKDAFSDTKKFFEDIGFKNYEGISARGDKEYAEIAAYDTLFEKHKEILNEKKEAEEDEYDLEEVDLNKIHLSKKREEKLLKKYENETGTGKQEKEEKKSGKKTDKNKKTDKEEVFKEEDKIPAPLRTDLNRKMKINTAVEDYMLTREYARMASDELRLGLEIEPVNSWRGLKKSELNSRDKEAAEKQDIHDKSLTFIVPQYIEQDEKAENEKDKKAADVQLSEKTFIDSLSVNLEDLKIKTDREFVDNLKDNYEKVDHVLKLENLINNVKKLDFDVTLQDIQRANVQITLFKEIRAWMDARLELIKDPYYVLLTENDVSDGSLIATALDKSKNSFVPEENYAQRVKAIGEFLKKYQNVKDCKFDGDDYRNDNDMSVMRITNFADRYCMAITYMSDVFAEKLITNELQSKKIEIPKDKNKAADLIESTAKDMVEILGKQSGYSISFVSTFRIKAEQVVNRLRDEAKKEAKKE